MIPLNRIKEGDVLASRKVERTLGVDFEQTRWVVKLAHLPERFVQRDGEVAFDRAIEARVPILPSVPNWRHLAVLTDEEREQLDLPGAKWLLTMRPYVADTPLAEIDDPRDRWRTTALWIAYSLRNLHDTGLNHGDLQPGNVVVGPDGVQLIDLPVFRKHPDDPGYVLGSAPFMAPELWNKEASSAASDIYALGRLVCWLGRNGRDEVPGASLSDWANYHTKNQLEVPEVIDGKLAGVLERTVAVDPSNRPPIQEVIDALAIRERDSLRPPYPVSPLQDSVVTETSRVLRQFIESGASRLAIVQPPGNAFFGRALETQFARRLELLGYREVDVVENAEAKIISLRNGYDRIDLIRDFSSDPGDFEHVVSFVPEKHEWDDWRSKTLRVEVRDISQKQWEQLRDANLERTDELIDAVNRQIGAKPPETESRDLVDAEGKAGAEPEQILDELEDLSTGQRYTEIAERCAQVRSSWFDRGPSESVERLLCTWIDALFWGGAGARNCDRCQVRAASYLKNTSSLEVGERFFNLLRARGLYRDGFQTLTRLRDLKDGEDVNPEVWFWRCKWEVQLSLSAGEIDNLPDVFDRLPDDWRDEHQRFRKSDVLQLRASECARDAVAGDLEAISDLRSLASEMRRADADLISTVARCHAYRALGFSRTDRHEDAVDAYLEALEAIEQGGLTLELPTYLLNAGTAFNRQGQLGLARQYYARGVRVSNSAVRPSTRALLMANQANIDRALGRLDEAESLMQRARRLAERFGLDGVEVMCASIEGDLWLERSDPEQALRAYRAPLEARHLNVSAHDEAELAIHCAEAALGREDSDESREWLDRAKGLIEKNQFDDLKEQEAAVRARIRWRSSGTMGEMGGLERFRRALIRSNQAGDYLFVLEQSPYILEQIRAQGLTDLEDELSELVDEAKRGVAMGLTDDLRRDFFEKLPSFEDKEFESSSTDFPDTRESSRQNRSVESSQLIEKFYRMLSLNEMIIQCEKLDSLWPRALEIGLNLSGAQRAFILLNRSDDQTDQDYEVVASRDLEGNSIPEPQLEVSLTIAEEAAETGQTVVTVNATDDDRFNTALSVIDLELTSVLCVPIQNSEGLLGALYLDHQFEAGIFEGETRRMIEAYGHQLAVEISSIRRRQRLRERQQELEKAQQQLQKLLDQRESELEEAQKRAETLTKQIERQRLRGSNAESFPEIAYASESMQQLMGQVTRISTSDISVVIQGESGVGKELIARAIHKHSQRSEGPFVSLNCGAVSESLFESELFGHKEGAFTGATSDKEGIFSAASGGTLFLDEIGEMPFELQVKLLRTLQEGQIRPVGASTTLEVDVRVVAATNRDIEQMVDEGQFREDLYYRLATLVLDVPPLRQRREDIPLIARHILDRIGESQDRDIDLGPDAAQLLSAADWKGNVRELENTLRAAAALTDSSELTRGLIAPLVNQQSNEVEADESGEPNQSESIDSETLDIIQRSKGRKPKASQTEVLDALKQANGDRERAAEMLGVSRRTIYRYLKRYGFI